VAAHRSAAAPRRRRGDPGPHPGPDRRGTRSAARHGRPRLPRHPTQAAAGEIKTRFEITALPGSSGELSPRQARAERAMPSGRCRARRW
jgi:hypothetical protein